MPKENTHAFFAQNVVFDLEKQNPLLAKKIKKNMAYFKMGSYFPDIFFYSSEFEKISKIIHGENKEKTNQFIFYLLEKISAKDEKSFSFICGILCHFGLDIVFHPMIFSLTGDFEKDPSAEYCHIQFETALDKKLTPALHLEKNLKILKNLEVIEVIEKYFQIEKTSVYKIYNKHLFFNRLFRIAPLYFIVLFFFKVGLMKNKKNLGVFYADASFNKISLPDSFYYENSISNKKEKCSISEMLDKASLLTIRYIEGAEKFIRKEISKGKLAEIIKGENLSTGKVRND